MTRASCPNGQERCRTLSDASMNPALTGFDLQRKLPACEVECVIGAVSKTFGPSGDKVRTDRRDAAPPARIEFQGSLLRYVGVALSEMDEAGSPGAGSPRSPSRRPTRRTPSARQRRHRRTKGPWPSMPPPSSGW